MITVEHGDDVDAAGACGILGGDEVKRMVQVAGLGVIVHRPLDVSGTERRAHLGDPVPIPVVEHPGLVGRCELARGRNGRRQHLERLVVGRDQHRDPEAAWRRRDRLGGRAVDTPQREALDDEADQRQRFETHQQPSDGEVPAADRKCVGDTPSQVGDQCADRGDATEMGQPPRSPRFNGGRAELRRPARVFRSGLVRAEHEDLLLAHGGNGRHDSVPAGEFRSVEAAVCLVDQRVRRSTRTEPAARASFRIAPPCLSIGSWQRSFAIG